MTRLGKESHVHERPTPGPPGDPIVGREPPWPPGPSPLPPEPVPVPEPPEPPWPPAPPQPPPPPDLTEPGARRDRPQPGGPAESGHRSTAEGGARVIEAWAPDRASCTAEALAALVDQFATRLDTPATDVIPLATEGAGAEDDLVALLEEVIYDLDVFDAVPVRFHLAETEEGGLAGDMEVIPAGEVELVGPAPKGVRWSGLSMGPTPSGWRCRVLVEV